MFRLPRPKTFRSKLLLGMCVLLILLGSAMIVLTQYIVLRDMRQTLLKCGIYFAKDLAHNAESLVLTEDLIKLQDLVTSADRREDVVYVFLLDKAGQVVVHSFGEAFPAGLKDVHPFDPAQIYDVQRLASEKDTIFDIAVPLLKGRAGVLRLGISEQSVRRTIGQTRGIIFGVMLILLLCGCLFIVYLVRRFVRSLEGLATAAVAISGGQLQYKVPVADEEDELKRLGLAFNAMTERLCITLVSRDDLLREKEAREKIEVARERMEQRYAGLVKNLAIGIFRIASDAKGSFVEVNPAMSKLLEVDIEEDLLRRGLWEFCWKEKVCRDVSDKLLTTGAIKSEEIEFVTANGRRFWGAVTAIICQEMPDRIFFDGILEDIAERREALGRLRRSYDVQTALNKVIAVSLEDISLEELLGRVIDEILAIPWLALESKGAIFLVDENDPQVLVMRAQRKLALPLLSACRNVPFGRCLCGRAASSKKIEFFAHLDEKHEITYQGILGHGHYCVPMVMRDQTIGVINLYVSEGHARDPKEEEFLQTVANALVIIIQHKKTSETVRRTRDFYLKLFEDFAMLIWRSDIHGEFDYFNRAWFSFTGKTLDQEKGRGWIQNIHPEDAEAFIKAYEGAFQLQKPFELEYRLKRFDETYRWVINFGRPFYDIEGKFAGYIGTCYDVTGRKESEKRVQEKILEVEKLNQFMMGREKRIIELKKEVDDALRVGGKPLKYGI